MKSLLYIFVFIALWLSSCSSSDNESIFTGEEVTFPMVPGDGQDIMGSVTIRELVGGNAQFEVNLSNTIQGFSHPVHLHEGAVDLVDAEVLALLTNLDGGTGESLTDLSFLADETEISFEEILNGEFHIKVHQGAVGAEANIILAAGDIGSAFEGVLSTENSTISVCQSK